MHRLLKISMAITELQSGLMDLKEGMEDLRQLDKESARLTAETDAILRRLERRYAKFKYPKNKDAGGQSQKPAPTSQTPKHIPQVRG